MPNAEVATMMRTLSFIKASWFSVFSSASILPLKGSASKPSRVSRWASSFVRFVRDTYTMAGQLLAVISARSFKYLSLSSSVCITLYIKFVLVADDA